MNSSVAVVICLAAFVLAIYMSSRWKINVGVLSMAFSYIIGCFLLHLSVNEIVALFPIKILFLLYSVCFFYGFAIENGTLQLIADKIIYHFRGHTRFLPFVLYLLAFGLAAMGASAPAVSSFLAPVCILIGASTGIHYMIMLILICLGSGAGSLVPWGQGGLIIRGVIEETHYVADASSICLRVCLNFFFTGLIALVITYFVFRGYQARPCNFEKPGSLNRVQKKTLLILGIVLALVLIPSIINAFHPLESVREFAGLFDIQMLSIVGAVICMLLHLGDGKKVMTEQVPWNMIIQVCGVCMLLGVTTQTGIFDTITSVLSGSLSQTLLSCLLIILGGFMSFFSGAMSVVIPLFLPSVLTISAAGGYSPVLLISSLTIGAIMTCTSPFSTAGSFVLSCVPDDAVRDRMFARQFAYTCVLFVIPILLAIIGAYGIF